MIARKLCVLLLLVLIFSFAFPVSASETSTYTTTEPSLLQQESKLEIPAEETHEMSRSEETDGPTNDGWFSALDIAYTVSSLVISLVVCGLIALICKKELPQKDITLHTFLLFITVSCYRLLLSILGTSSADFIGVLFIALVYTAFLFFYFKLSVSVAEKTEGTNIEPIGNIRPKPEAKAISYIKAKINKSHPCIESIQLYRYSISETGGTVDYDLEYIDGARRDKVEINALIGLNLHLNKETVAEVKAIMSLYNDYMNPETKEQIDTYRQLLIVAIDKGTQRIMKKLESIQDVKDVKSTDCSLARVLMVYCSILASLDKETTFVGFGDNALGINKEIEHALFTYKRTGVLGAILLQDYPYAFYYNRNGDKTGRIYCSFVCSNEAGNYLALIALRLEDNAIVPNLGMSDALLKIKTNITKVLESPKKEVE